MDERLNPEPIGMGVMWAVVHMLRVMVNRGLASPGEIDQIYGSLIEGFQSGDPAVAALLENRLSGPFAELRQWAEKLWIGRGQTNPQ